jgi:hypothetical protein
MSLIKAADGAYAPDPASLPADVKVILGYVGAPGHTPHIWTPDEVQKARNSGRQWWPIWVPAQGLMSAATGTAAAQGMVSALAPYGVSKSTPVFFDVETSSWEASATGAQAAVAAFKSTMKAAGYTRPLGYLPRAAGFDWIANWTGKTPADAPASLPAGVIGQQYLGDYGSWDFSVFDASLLSIAQPTQNPNGEDDMSAEDVTAINAHTDRAIQILRTDTSLGSSIGNVLEHQESQGNAIASLQSDVDALSKSVAEILKAVQSK